jgi:hypothetical protein
VSWTERKTNQQKLQKLRPNISFEVITKILKMPYFEHVMKAHQSLDKDIMLGITGGARKKGKPRMWWMDDIKSLTGLSVNDLNQLVKDRKRCKFLVNNLVKKRKRTNI